MERKYKQNLLVSIVFALIVSITLFYMHNNYIFQTYGDVVYYDYILNGENDDIKVENVEVYHRKDSFSIGSGSIVVKNSDLINMETNFNVNIILENKDQKKEYQVELENYPEDNLKYRIQKISRKSNKSDLEDATKAKLIINNNGKTINELNLKILPVEQLEGANKEYRIENASISNQMMRLGSLKTTDEQIIKKYPNISLEYRYLKDEKLNKDNDDNYIVFKKISGKSKELVNSNDYGLFYLNEGNFKNKNLSVVIIFSNNDDKYVFSIDLTIQQVGDYYG
ncbi:MAG: hypothetical protein KHX14_08775 [[Clostridium] spiroforme]|uniref:Uncharacterized protein n=1 Tax=Thomasclavelia spiroformis TaxID=29348 RepID=A0A943EIR6_9FIRM|nr:MULTISPECIES: hypothetical protein [Thomasclavelia]MBS5588884.1 hypothetical protein [Thomasclavelia spiroformis]